MRIMVDVGAQVEKGTPVFTMQKENSYVVRMLVSKYDISSLQIGQKAKIYVGNDEYRGTLKNISQYAENDASGKSKASVSIEVYTDESMILGLESDV